MKTNTGQIIERAKAGDKNAFEKLYRRTYDRNYYIVFKILNNEQDTLDVLQETYIKIFTKIGLYTYRGWDSFLAWTGKVAANTALDSLRRKNPILFTEMDRMEEAGIMEFDIEDPSEAYRPEIAYDKKETAAVVEELLGCLSEEQRICVMLYYLQDMSIKEIAELCGCPENTVKSRLYYARKKIQAKGEDMEKRGLHLFGMTPFVALAYALKQDAAVARAAGVREAVLTATLGSAWSSDGTASTVAAVGKTSLIAKLGIGKMIAVVATASLSTGLAVGVVLGRQQSQPLSTAGTEQTVIESEETVEEMTQPEKAVTEKKEISEDMEQVERTIRTTEKAEEEMPAATEKKSEEEEARRTAKIPPLTTEGAETAAEAEMETAVDIQSVEWDDDYIEWDD